MGCTGSTRCQTGVTQIISLANCLNIEMDNLVFSSVEDLETNAGDERGNNVSEEDRANNNVPQKEAEVLKDSSSVNFDNLISIDCSDDDGGRKVVIESDSESFISDQPLSSYDDDEQEEATSSPLDSTDLRSRLNYLSHAKECSFICDLCPKTKKFKSAEDLFIHKTLNHSSFSCDVCLCDFKSEKCFKEHNEVVHSRFVCHQCSEEFSTAKARTSHEYRRHFFYLYRCEKCSMDFQSELDLTKHKCKYQNQKKKHVNCDECHLHFPTIRALNKHKKKSHSSVACEQCSKKFLKEVDLQQHRNSHKMLQDDDDFLTIKRRVIVN